MSYYIIKSGSIQDIKTAQENLNKIPDLRIPFFLLECDDEGNVIREIGGGKKLCEHDYLYWIQKRYKQRYLIAWQYYNKRKIELRKIADGESVRSSDNK